MSERHDESRFQALFAELRESPHFVRAPMQLKALSILLGAAANGETLTGSVLAERLYGKSDHDYVRAAQQVVRELRLKLMSANADRPRSQARIEIAPSGYRVFVVEGTEHVSPAVQPVAAPAANPQAHGSKMQSLRPSRRAMALLAAIAIAIPLLIAAIRALGRSPERALDHVEVRDAEVRAFDAHGEPLEEWEVAIRRARLVPRNESTLVGAVFPSARAALLEGPGSRPDLAVLSCDPHSAYACRIAILDGSTKDVREVADLPFFASHVGRPASLHELGGEELPPWFIASGLVAADLDGDGRRDEVVVTARQQRAFPCAVFGLDPQDGWKNVFEYWTMGETEPYAIPDLDGDRADEILLYGTNNSTWSGYAVLLPPIPTIRGTLLRAPGGQRRALLEEAAQWTEAGLAIQFPSTLLSSPEFPEYGSWRGSIIAAGWNRDRRQLSLTQQEGARPSPSGDWLKLEFVLDTISGCSAVRFLSYDTYLAEFRKLSASGRISDRWGIGSDLKLERYGDELRTRVLWCDPSKGVPWTSEGLGEALRRRLEGTQKVSTR